MKWVYLLLAIVSEVVATSALKSSESFSRLWPSVLTVVGYGVAFYLLSLTLRELPVGIADMERRGDCAGLAGSRRTVRPEARSAGPDRDGTHRCGGNRNQRLLEKRSTLTCNF